MAVDKSIFKMVLALLFGIAYSFGLLSCAYSRRERRFYINNLLMIWCIGMTITVTIGSAKQLYAAYNDDKINLANAETLYYYISIVGVVLSYICQLVQTTELREFLSNVPLFEILDYFELKRSVVKSSIQIILVKTVVFPIILEINLLIRQSRNEPEESLLKTFYTLFPTVVSNFLPNCAFSSIVVCYHTMRALNLRLEKIEKEANFYQDVKQMILHKHFYRMQKFCNLADTLDELSQKYTLICGYTLRYVDINSVAIMATLLCNLFAITGGLFQEYNALADTFINKKNYDVFDALTNGVFLSIAVADIALYGSMANDCLEAVSWVFFSLRTEEIHFYK